MAKNANAPVTQFDVRGVTASVFENERTTKAGKAYTTHTVRLQRSYKDAQGNWQHTDSLDVDDILKAVAALEKAYDHIAVSERVSKAKQSQQQEAQAEQDA